MIRGGQSNENDRFARAHVVVARMEDGSLSKNCVRKAVSRTGQLRFLGKDWRLRPALQAPFLFVESQQTSICLYNFILGKNTGST